MWLFTKYGFYSAVCARTMNDAGLGQADRGRIVVRARVRRHLEALRSRFPGELADSPVVDDEGTDYAYRLYVAKPVWKEVVGALVEELDYHNFKDAVYSVDGASAYERALHDVWSTLYDLQSKEA